MYKLGGTRNFGYGKQIIYACKNALRDYYGSGKYGTVHTHHQRFKNFARFLKSEFDIIDARRIKQEHLEAYGRNIWLGVIQGDYKVSYAKNLISSANRVMFSFRRDNSVSVEPLECIKQARKYGRTEAPRGLDLSTVFRAAEELRQNGHDRVACLIELARVLGLRFREAALLDAHQAFQQACKGNMVNITDGTKGGRGFFKNRWIEVNTDIINVLERTAAVQGKARTLIPLDTSFDKFRNDVYIVWREVREEYGLRRIHDLRAAYACARYKAITKTEPPAISGKVTCSREKDYEARETLSYELGHNRVDVVTAYIGGIRF